MISVYTGKTLTRRQAEILISKHSELTAYGFDLKYTTKLPSNAGIIQLNRAILEANRDTITLSHNDKMVLAENLNEQLVLLSEIIANEQCFITRLNEGILIDEEGNDLRFSSVQEVIESDHYSRMHGELGLETTLESSVDGILSTKWLTEQKDKLEHIKEQYENDFNVVTPLSMNNEQYEQLNETFDNINALHGVYAISI